MPHRVLAKRAQRARPDPERLLGGEEDLGITVALVPADTAGVRQGERHLPLNVPFQNGPLYGEDVFAPLEWIIGERGGIGRGWQMLVECLAHGRAISLPAQATGSSKLACRATGAYARVALEEDFQYALLTTHFSPRRPPPNYSPLKTKPSAAARCIGFCGLRG